MKLRRILESDYETLFRWRNDPRIYEWCRQNSPLHWDKHLDWCRAQARDPRLDMFVMLGDSGNPVGVCGLTDICLINRRAEFSLYIGPEHQGNGYAYRGLEKLLEHGFDTLGLNRIYGETFDGNRAQNIFEKMGMVCEGVRRDFYFRCGRFVNAKLYSISCGEFRDRQKGKASTGCG